MNRLQSDSLGGNARCAVAHTPCHTFLSKAWCGSPVAGSIYWPLFCTIGGIGLYFTYRSGVLMPREYSVSPSCFFLYIMILAPVQELIFRGILFAEMKRYRNIAPAMMVLISTIIFSFLHIIYNHPALLLIAFVSGLVWGDHVHA